MSNGWTRPAKFAARAPLPAAKIPKALHTHRSKTPTQDVPRLTASPSPLSWDCSKAIADVPGRVSLLLLAEPDLIPRP